MTAAVALEAEPVAGLEVRSGSAAVTAVPPLDSRPRGNRVPAESGCVCGFGRAQRFLLCHLAHDRVSHHAHNDVSAHTTTRLTGARLPWPEHGFQWACASERDSDPRVLRKAQSVVPGFP